MILAARGEIEFEAVGDIVLDQEGGLADRRALGIGDRRARARCRSRPTATIGTLSVRPPRPWSGTSDAAIFDAVRPLDHQRQRHVRRRRALRVAQQRRHVHGLAGAIDAALGIDEGIEPGRHRPAGDAAVGQIEGRRFQAEEGVVGLARRRRARPAPGRPRRASSPASKCTKPSLSVGLVASTSLLRAISRTSTWPARLGARQRMDEDVDAVVAGIGGQPEIGDDEPLASRAGRSRSAPRPSAPPSSHRRRASRSPTAWSTGNAVVTSALSVCSTASSPLHTLTPRSSAEPLDLVAVEIALEVAAEHGVDQIAVADAVDRRCSTALVLTLTHRNAALAGARQHIGLAGKAHERLAVAHDRW